MDAIAVGGDRESLSLWRQAPGSTMTSPRPRETTDQSKEAEEETAEAASQAAERI